MGEVMERGNEDEAIRSCCTRVVRWECAKCKFYYAKGYHAYDRDIVFALYKQLILDVLLAFWLVELTAASRVYIIAAGSRNVAAL